MINSKMICKIMGSLFFIEAGFLILCALLAIYYKETDLTASFLPLLSQQEQVLFSLSSERTPKGKSAVAMAM